LGAGATLVVSIVTARSQAGREAVSWQRQRKQAAYDSTIRALIRVRNRRARMAEAREGLIAKEELPTALSDLVDAQVGFSMLRIDCGARQREMLDKASEKLDGLVGKLLNKPRPDIDLDRIAKDVGEIYKTVVDAARDDIGLGGA
jgi:hypothetical protein